MLHLVPCVQRVHAPFCLARTLLRPLAHFFIGAGVAGRGATLAVFVAPQSPVIRPRGQAGPRLFGWNPALAVRQLRCRPRLALERGLLDQLLARSEEGVGSASRLGLIKNALPGLERLLAIGAQGAKPPQKGRRVECEGVQIGDHHETREGHLHGGHQSSRQSCERLDFVQWNVHSGVERPNNCLPVRSSIAKGGQLPRRQVRP